MCEVDIYHNKKTEESILKKRVSEYDVDLGHKRLTVRSPLGEAEEFQFSEVTSLKWQEKDDSLVIEGILD